jgi:biopolymer transport protein ExbB
LGCAAPLLAAWAASFAAGVPDAPSSGVATNRQAEVLAAAFVQTRADIAASLDELTRLRDQLSGKRRSLAQTLSAAEAEVKALREKAEQARSRRRQADEEEQALRNETQRLEDECQFVRTLFSEYRRSLETRAGVAETLLLAPSLADIDSVLNKSAIVAALPAAGRKLLGVAEWWNVRKAGGIRFDGPALDAAGVEHPGRFAVVGPLEFFSTPEGRVGGIVVSRLGSGSPSLFSDLSEEDKRAIDALLNDGRSVPVPMDVTSGDAMTVRAARWSLSEHIRKGGFVMIPILAVGLVAFVLAVWKGLEGQRLCVSSKAAVREVVELLGSGRSEQAGAAARRTGLPLADILLKGIEHRNAPKEHLEELLHEEILAHIPRIDRHLGTLAVLGGVAPLLGLLGTVTGMIHTFQLVAVFGTGDAKLLSGGISEALITTEFGLFIAIPVVVAHAFLVRRARTRVSALEHSAADFVHALTEKRSRP